MPDPHKLTRAWKAHLDGAVYGSPLVVGGRVIAVTEGDSLYSLDMHTGQVLWRTNVGTPVPLSTLPCGDIDPLGITSTPVYDPATRLVFAVAEVTGPVHILIGVDVDTGQVKVHRAADAPGMDPQAQQQRAALALSQGIVYIGYGGLAGDCSDYHGWVVGLRTDGLGPMLFYQVPTTRQGGIWGPSGPAVDDDGNIYVTTGNGAAVQGNWDHSDSVLRLSPELELEDGFAPATWQQENANDEDLGSMGPLLLPGGLVFADGKSGMGYLLKATNLGGIGGQALGMPVCIAFGGAAAVGSTIFIPCRNGLLQAQVGPGIRLSLGWRGSRFVTGSPVVGGHTVYSLFADQGLLYAYNMNTGALIAQVRVGKASHFMTPALYGNYIFVGTFHQVTAVIES
jgi:outer membrane protein assembly factor BamB